MSDTSGTPITIQERLRWEPGDVVMDDEPDGPPPVLPSPDDE